MPREANAEQVPPADEKEVGLDACLPKKPRKARKPLNIVDIAFLDSGEEVRAKYTRQRAAVQSPCVPCASSRTDQDPLRTSSCSLASRPQADPDADVVKLTLDLPPFLEPPVRLAPQTGNSHASSRRAAANSPQSSLLPAVLLTTTLAPPVCAGTAWRLASKRDARTRPRAATSTARHATCHRRRASHALAQAAQ